MADTSSAELLEFPKKDNHRFLHAVYRVGDLERSIKFYTEAFGMKLLRKRDVPEEKYSNAFLGFGPEESNFAVELTYNYGVDKYDIGTGFGHSAIATADVYKLAEDIKAKGGTITREPGPVKGGTSVIAFAKDPDGYLFELTERPHTPEPLCQVMLRVGDLDRSIKFYEKRSSDFSLMAVLRLLALFLAFVAALPEVKAQQEKDEPYVGVNIGTDISNFLPPAQLVSFLKQQKVTHIRLYDADPDILKALSKSKIRVIISVPNNQILGIGSSNTTAANWIKRNVVAFYPDTLISALAVGDEVLTTVPSLSSMLMPAIESLYSALVASNLHTRIKISTPHASNIILDPFPPSQAYFNETLSPVIVQLLRFLSRTNSPLMMNMYPYYVFMQNKGVVPLDNSLFKPLTPSKEMVDPNTLLHYTNVLDAMIDSAYSSMKNLNVSDVLVLVTETGWPSKGDSKEPYATIDNANTYNSNLIKHILDRSGTPFHPEVTSSVYIYELFNEDLRSSPVSEANWGLFYANSTPVYLLHVSGTGEFLANDTTNQTFCVAMDGVDGKTLQTALDWACGPGRANCSEIQPGESCYSPNNVKNHASYAFDSYYEKQGRAAGSCDFKGVAIITTTDPSHGLCVFPGSKIISNRTNTVVNSTNATSGVDPSRLIGTRPCNLLRGHILGIMFCLYVL